MSDAEQPSAGAMAGQTEAFEDCEAPEPQERAETEAFFEQTIVPGVKAAANVINQETANASGEEVPARAEVRQPPRTDDGISVELTVRRGEEVEFWFLGMARMRVSPVEWRFWRRPRVKRFGGTITTAATEREFQWDISMTDTTPEQIRDDVLKKYFKVRDARARQMG
jgi:hypothetical protein